MMSSPYSSSCNPSVVGDSSSAAALRLMTADRILQHHHHQRQSSTSSSPIDELSKFGCYSATAAAAFAGGPGSPYPWATSAGLDIVAYQQQQQQIQNPYGAPWARADFADYAAYEISPGSIGAGYDTSKLWSASMAAAAATGSGVGGLGGSFLSNGTVNGSSFLPTRLAGQFYMYTLQCLHCLN